MNTRGPRCFQKVKEGTSVHWRWVIDRAKFLLLGVTTSLSAAALLLIYLLSL